MGIEKGAGLMKTGPREADCPAVEVCRLCEFVV
jgi:hypothetical protein